MAERKQKTNSTSPTPQPQKLYRSETNRMLAGVCGGLGEYFKIDPSIVRFVFVLITVFGGSGILLYIILWIILPTESDVVKPAENHIKANVEEIKQRAEKFAEDLKVRDRSDERRFGWGIVIIVVGALFLLGNFGIFSYFSFGRLWPLLLILIGIFVLLRKR